MRFLGYPAIVGAVLALAVFSANTTAAVTYSFTRIADSATMSPAGILDAVGIGKASVSGGSVAFQGCYGGGAGCGVFTGNGGALTTIVKDGTAAPIGNFTSVPPEFGGGTFVGRPAVAGTVVAFQAGYQFNSLTGAFDKFGIFTGNGGAAVTTIVKSDDAAPSGTFSSFLDATISGTTVAFQGGYGTNLKGVFTRDSGGGGSLTTIAKSNDVVPSVGTLTGFSAPAVSGSTTAFKGDYSGGQGIFTGSGGALAVISKAGDPAPIGTFDATGFFEPALSGTSAAFRARYNTSFGTGIFRGNGGPLTTIVKLGDPAPVGAISSLLSDPSISGNNVAFIGNYGAQHALFVGSGGPLTPVIKKGDLLFGSTVSTVTFEKFGFDTDGSGKLAFGYTLANGRAGVAIATPGGLPIGDYNQNNSIDAADYVLWRDTFGQSVAEGSGADGNYNGVIDVNDYFLWRARFGQQGETGSGSAAAAGAGPANVPEPMTLVLLGLGAVSAAAVRRRNV
jgi:PEP-CTERM motif-containing protein